MNSKTINFLPSMGLNSVGTASLDTASLDKNLGCSARNWIQVAFLLIPRDASSGLICFHWEESVCVELLQADVPRR